MAVRITLSNQSLLAVGIAGVLALGGVSLIRANAQANIAEQRIPLPVATTVFRSQAGYQRMSRYVGSVRATTDSAMSFEVGGQLTSLSVREGTRVSAGDALATLDVDRRTAQLNRAQAQYEQISSDLELAQKRRARVTELVARGLASEQSLDEATLGAQSLASARDAAKAALLDARIQLAKSTLRAPYDAIVAERLVQPGATVAAGTPVLRLVAETQREAHVGVPVAAARRLTIGQSYSLSLGGQTITAPLLNLRDDLDSRTLTLAAIFTLPSAANAAVGQPIELSITTDIEATGGWLPLTALIEGQRGLWTVLRVVHDGTTATTARESVDVIAVAGDQAFVRGTLADGAEVIATGLQRISPGATIAPIAPAATPTLGD